MSSKALEQIKQVGKTARRTASKVQDSELMDLATDAGGFMLKKAGDLKETAQDVKEDIDEKLNELDRMLEQVVTDYNDAYTLMNDKGMRLYIERCRAADLIENVETLVNSIANRPKAFDADFAAIETSRKKFTDGCEFAEKELQAARNAAGNAGAGLAAGATVAFLAPTAAMWVATTFGTASTGVAISTLSGAAASNAALAWLGGGALVAGGKGMAAGSALLAMAGPIGWTIAGAALLSTIILFAKKRMKINSEKNEEIEAVKQNIAKVKEVDLLINNILEQTVRISDGLKGDFTRCLNVFGRDYLTLSEEQKVYLGSMVNNAKTLGSLFEKTIDA